MSEEKPKYPIGAVSFLNTVPLVWGMLKGPQQTETDVSFSLPSKLAPRLENREIQIGLVPVAEIARRELEIVPGVGIACSGAVRSILLISRVPWHRVRTLSADLSSRTSVELALVVLRERFRINPAVHEHRPALDEMLAEADAALLIGDSALEIVPEDLPYEWLDLGVEWMALTGLPMVFAAWAGEPGLPQDDLQRITRGSFEFGSENLTEIVEQEYQKRRITRALADEYLRHYIRFELGRREQQGLQAFYELARLGKYALAEQR